MGYNYRCTDRDHCGKRVTLAQPIGHYVKRPVCPECKRDRLKSVNRKEKARSRRRRCTCRGAEWVHNRGAVVDADHTCVHADPAVVEEMALNDEIGVQESRNVTGQECPF